MCFYNPLALAHPRSCHIKNKSVWCAFSQFFLIHLFSTLLVIVFLISLVKLFNFYLLFFVHIVTCSFSCSQLKSKCVRRFTPVSFVCICNKKYKRCFDFIYQFFMASFFLNLYSKLSSVILLNSKE